LHNAILYILYIKSALMHVSGVPEQYWRCPLSDTHRFRSLKEWNQVGRHPKCAVLECFRNRIGNHRSELSQQSGP